MKTILARVNRNVKEDPSIPKTNIWNVETVFLEKLPDEEVSLVSDPKKIGVEQIPSKLDSTRTAFTIRTRADRLSKEGDTIQVGVHEASSRDMATGVSYYDVFIQTPPKATLIVGVANTDTDQVTSMQNHRDLGSRR